MVEYVSLESPHGRDPHGVYHDQAHAQIREVSNAATRLVSGTEGLTPEPRSETPEEPANAFGVGYMNPERLRSVRLVGVSAHMARAQATSAR